MECDEFKNRLRTGRFKTNGVDVKVYNGQVEELQVKIPLLNISTLKKNIAKLKAEREKISLDFLLLTIVHTNQTSMQW